MSAQIPVGRTLLSRVHALRETCPDFELTSCGQYGQAA